jgi:hypothetical protein
VETLTTAAGKNSNQQCKYTNIFSISLCELCHRKAVEVVICDNHLNQLMIDYFKANPAVLIASLALLVSAFSATLSFFSFRLNRRHNINSVKPIIHIGQWDYEDNIYVTLVNQGTGVAIVKQLLVHNGLKGTKTNIYEWLPKKLPKGMDYKHYWTPYRPSAVPPGETIKLIELPIVMDNREQAQWREQIRAILGKLTVQVVYEDIYKNKMDDARYELTHFLRTDNVNTER